MRILGVEPIIWPARKSCISPSDSAATAPVMPLDTMLARRSPGAMHAEQRLHQIGHRADRSPVRLAQHAQRHQPQRHGRAAIATTECQTGVPKKSDCTTMRNNAATRRRSTPTSAANRRTCRRRRARPLNVRTRTRHRSSSAAMPPATSIPTAGHMTSSRMSTRRASGAISPCDSSHGGAMHPADDAADQHAGADAQADDHARADVEQRDAEAEPDRAPRTRSPRRGMLSAIQRSCVARNSSPDETSEPTIAKADLRACSPRESSMISVSPAAMPSGKGRFSSSMKCLRSGTASSTPSSPDADSQIERLHAREVDVEAAAGFSRQHVERREQPAQKRDLPRRRARRLDDVVLPAVVVLREEPERQEPEEGRDDRDVGAESELEDDVGIRGADDQRDEQADDDRTVA